MGEAEEAGSLRTTDRIVDWLDKAKKLVETLSPWHDREKISGPTKQLPPSDPIPDDEIPF